MGKYSEAEYPLSVHKYTHIQAYVTNKLILSILPVKGSNQLW